MRGRTRAARLRLAGSAAARAARAAAGRARGARRACEAAPLMLLDDVMSELDAAAARALVELLRAGEGQAVITATDLEQVPGRRGGRRHAPGGRRRRRAGRGRRRRALTAASPRSLAFALDALADELAPATVAGRGAARLARARSAPAIAGAGPADGRARRRPHGLVRRRGVGAGARSDGRRRYSSALNESLLPERSSRAALRRGRSLPARCRGTVIARICREKVTGRRARFDRPIVLFFCTTNS